MMTKRSCRRWQGFRDGGGSWLAVAVHFLLLLSVSTGTNASHRKVKDRSRRSELSTGLPVHLKVYKDLVVMDNGMVRVSFSNPGGEVVGINYGGIDNLLESRNEISNRGYLDVVWNWPRQSSAYDRVDGTKFSIIAQTEDIVEISFVRTWDKKSDSHVSPFIIDKRFIMRRNVSGFYSYAVFDHPKGWPGFEMGQARVAYKLNGEQFHFMAISDRRQRIMPTPLDRERGKILAYPEAVLLTNPSNPDLKGEVDDKYQYSSESQEDRVHGWISDDPVVGFWMISPSDEFRTGGPVKQELTCHVGPVALNMFVSSHYAGRDIGVEFTDGEPWKKVFGPFMVYLNSDPPKRQYSALWEDAKRQMLIETKSWPYDFTKSEEFPASRQRGTVTGQLLIQDRYQNENNAPADSAYVGLAALGKVGSWQTESKGYQFWTRADSFGNFTIGNVRAGVYNLYAWVPGIVGDYKYEANITVTPRRRIVLGSLVYEPPRSGPTIWEIGVPDRTAAEFYVPAASPMLMNKLYTELEPDWFRQYGLWERYTELYPQGDLVYTVGTSDFTKDWFFAHVTRSTENSTYAPTTWQINFELQDAIPKGTYTLQMALASATFSEIQVRFNDPSMGKPLFTTMLIGSDNAIARHGIHGLYHFYSIQVPGDNLRRGSNTLALTQSRATTPFQGVMYDYIRLEGPPHPS